MCCRFSKIYEYLRKTLFFKALFRIMIDEYLLYQISAMLNFKNVISSSIKNHQYRYHSITSVTVFHLSSPLSYIHLLLLSQSSCGSCSGLRWANLRSPSMRSGMGSSTQAWTSRARRPSYLTWFNSSGGYFSLQSLQAQMRRGAPFRFSYSSSTACLSSYTYMLQNLSHLSSITSLKDSMKSV